MDITDEEILRAIEEVKPELKSFSLFKIEEMIHNADQYDAKSGDALYLLMRVHHRNIRGWSSERIANLIKGSE